MRFDKFFKKILLIYLFAESGEEREKERERNDNVWLPLEHPPLGIWLVTQACALTGNWTCDPLVCRLALNPLSHNSQEIFKIFYFFKSYFIVYAITVFLIFPPLALSTQPAPHSLRQSPYYCPCPWVMYICSMATIFPVLTFTFPWLFCNTNLYFIIPSHFSPISLTPFLSGNHQNGLCIYDSVSVLLVHLFCFLDSIVDRYIFIAILLFIFFISLFLKKTL